MNEQLFLVFLLFTKHFVVDFPLQNKFQWSNKGTYGHLGGVVHSFLHGIGTYFCFLLYAPYAAAILGLIDMVIHYHVDWAKMNLNRITGWKPDTSEKFWWLLGFDQYLHALTYIALINMVTK